MARSLAGALAATEMRDLLRRLGIKALAGLVASCALWSPLVAMPAVAAPSQTCIYEGGSPTTPATNIPGFPECDSGRKVFTKIAAPVDGSGYVQVDVAAGSITVTFPYAGTNGQTLTASSFVGVGALDANGKFSPLQEDASQNLLAKIVSGSTTAVTQATAANLNATVVFPSAQSVNATLQAGSANAGGVEIFDSGGTNKLAVNSNGSVNTILYNSSAVGIQTTAGGTLLVAPATTATPAAISTPASSASSVTVLAANAARNGYTVCNSSTQILYLAKAATATTGSYTLALPAAGTVPTCVSEDGLTVYRGILTGIWASANGNAVVTEW